MRRRRMSDLRVGCIGLLVFSGKDVHAAVSWDGIVIPCDRRTLAALVFEDSTELSLHRLALPLPFFAALNG
jgi:hypothetical protein